MIKNGRPYSNENGSIDDGLITSHPDNEINIVKQWIADNIMISEKILSYQSSYGLKHLLQHDTGIYLTNNEFKDAMLMAGYQPVNPNDLNWRYYIVLKRTINDNPSNFFKWAKQYESKNSPIGDFVRDMLGDFDFPTQEDYDVIEDYLTRKNACAEAKKTFKQLWNRYKKAVLL